MRVLVAEDERRVAGAIERGLRREGLGVDLAHDGRSALAKARAGEYDVLVLDRGLPELHGDEVCRAVVAELPATRVLMLTALGETDDLVEGLALGADDYLTKPFAFAELVARVRALARRAPRERPPVLESGDVVLDSGRHRVTRAGREVSLTPKEFGVLETLLQAGGQTVSSDELLRRVWDENIDPITNTARMTVMTLRRKLGEPPFIHTVKGAGYRV
ncbi:MAG TPA: response regulator transcription factor [Thermoleophilaceae bacterium]|nr:response regulator transcription factor [Thermoleophilaceae bacterium]